MSDRLPLDLGQLAVESFPTAPEPEPAVMPVDSWPAVCTCINICQPTADIYCSGGCPPYAVPYKQTADGAVQ